MRIRTRIRTKIRVMRLRRPSGRWGRRVRLAALLGLLFFTGCAYFNTFYFARKYYDQAEKLRETSASDKLPVDAIRKYEKAIFQCKKVLNFHADSRWVDDAVFLMGASYYGKAEYDSALRTFDGLLEGFPGSDFVARAHYYKGLCFHEREDYEEMELAFRAALDADPEFERRDDILFTLARTAEEQGDRNKAVSEYRVLIRTYPGKVRAEDALFEIGRLYFDAGVFDSSLIAYEELVATTKDEERFQQATLAMSQSLVRLGRPEEAIRQLERHLPSRQEIEAERGNDWPARVKLSLAQALNAQDRHDEAIEQLREIVELYRSSPYATEAQYQIGYTYESYMDSLSAAELAYDEATKMSSQSSFRDLARTRLGNVKKLITLSSEVTPAGDQDLERKAEAALQIAELYYFTERKIDQAVAQYERVVAEFPETRSAPKAAYALGWIRLREREDRDGGVSAFRDVVFDFPASEQARSAIDILIEEEADTTGLRAALVEPAPVEVSAPVDSLHLTLPADSLQAWADSTGEPLASPWPDSLHQGAGIDSMAWAREDSVRADGRSSRADSLRALYAEPAADSVGGEERRQIDFRRSRPTAPRTPPQPVPSDSSANRGVGRAP